MRAAPQTAAPSGRKRIAQGKERSDAALGHEPQNSSSPEGAKSIADLPGGWRIARVGDILKVRNGYAFKSTDYKTEGVPLIRQSDLGDDVVEIAEAKCVDARFLSELPGFVVRDGDLLIGMSGSLGEIARYQHAGPALQNQRTGLLLVKPEHDPKFAKLVLKFVEPQILAEGKGVAVQNVSAKEIEDCTFPLPPFPDQRRIVAEIEKQFTRLEAGVAALRRVQANLKRYRAAVLKAACEGKLVPTEAELARVGRVPPRGVRPNAKNAASGDAAYNEAPYESGEQLLQRILAERRKNWTGRGKYKEPAAPDTANLLQLPEGWTWATVEQLSTRVQYGSSAKTDEDSDGVPVLRMGNIQDGRFDSRLLKYLPKAHDEFPELLLATGDLLFNRTNSPELVGKTAIFKGSPHPCSFASYLIRVRFGHGCIPDFVSYFINSVLGRAWIADVVSQQVGQANVNGTKLQALAIPLPPLAEQTRIVAEVERRLSVVEELEAVVSANLQHATRLRQSILQKAFSGELLQPA
ncbi:MAG: restriction endonuclease subunit S [Limisphaerales bacterium]